MKKQDWFIITTLIIIIQFIFIIKFSFFQEQRTYQIPEYYRVHEEKNDPWPEKVVDDPVALFTLILTLFTGGLYLATRSLWTSTEKLVFGAEKTAAMQLRAYVGIGMIYARDADGAGVRQLQVDIKNFGQTPATKYVARIRFTNNKRLLANSFEVKSGHQSTLMPGAIDSIIVNVTHDTTPLLTPEYILVGSIFYIDAFNERRFTNFRFVYNVKSDTFAADETGNESS